MPSRFQLVSILALSVVVSIAGGCGLPSSEEAPTIPSSQNPVQVTDDHASGTISLPEISGARVIGQMLLVVADDAVSENDDVAQYHMVAAVHVDRILAGGVVDLREADHRYRRIVEHLDPTRRRSDLITDLEAVASDDRYVYLVSSHSRSQRGNYPAKRRRLTRIQLSGSDVTSAEFSAARLERILPPELEGSTDRRPGEVDDAGRPDPGFNIEGMAVSPGGELLFGLRSPLIDGKAIVLAANAESLWNPDREHRLELRHLLDLGGLGIRAMERDERRSGYWLIAGAASDVDMIDNPWSIWFWSDGGQLTRRWTHEDVSSEIRNPEALTIFPGEVDHLLVISDNGDKRPSTFVLLPFPN